MRAILGGAALLASAGLGIALAATGGEVDPTPPVVVITPPADTAGSASVTLTNNGSASVTVGELVPDGTCDDGVTTTPVNPLPFAIPASQGRGVTVTCAATSATSIRRCEIHARTAAHAPIADYTGLCVSPGTFALSLSPGSGVAFGDVAIGAELTLPITLTNTGASAATAESIDVADQAGDFEIGSPCPNNGPRCDATETIAAGSALSFDLQCSPTQLGARATNVYVVTSNGGAIGPYAVTCNGVSGGGGPSLSLDVPAVDVGDVAVATGSTSSTIHVTNIGGNDLHIASIAIAGGAAADWAFAASTPCGQAPCTLAASASIDIEVTLDPSALDGRHSTLEIQSDDASHPTTSIPLDGNGVGATLATATDLGSGIDLGTASTGATSTFALVLRNDGNAPLAPVTLAITQDNSVFGVSPSSLTIGPSGQAVVTITCAPSDHIPFTGSLAITATGALTGSPIAIPLTCTGAVGDLVATPSPIQLGEIRTGTGIATQTITLTTLGAAQTITAGPSLTTPSTSLSFGDLSSTSVTTAAPATFTIAVDPQADAPLADHVTITAGAETIDLPITGSVVTAEDTSSSIRNLGSFCVGAPTATAIVSLTASGTASVGLPQAPAMAMGTASPFELAPVEPSVFPFTLPAGGRATAQVTAKRQGIAGTVTDDVVWSHDIAGSAAPSTTIDATFIDDGGAVSPGAVDFGSSPIHLLESPVAIITIQDCGTEAMTLGAPAIAPSGAFFTAGALPSQLLPAQSATFSVGFGPVSVGSADSTLTIAATIGTSMFPLAVQLHGNGIIDSPPDTDAGTSTHTTSQGCGCESSGDATGVAMFAMCAFALRRRRRAVRII